MRTNAPMFEVEDLETRIEHACMECVRADDTSTSRAAFLVMARLISQRSLERIAEMERARGLRVVPLRMTR